MDVVNPRNVPPPGVANEPRPGVGAPPPGAAEPPQPSMASLVAGIVSDVQKLMRQEVELARREIQQEWEKAKTAAASLAASFLLALLSGVLFCFMFVYLLHEAAGLSRWVSFLIVAVVLAVIAGGLFFAGRSKASEVHVIPPQTAETMKENVEWLQKQT